MDKSENLPKKAGVYWAKRLSDSFNLVVHVIGEAPFLKVSSVIDLDQKGNKVIDEWGPEIINPTKVLDA